MASSVSSLSLFILVLISGYFTLPIIDNQVSDVTSFPFEDVLTTERNFNSRAIFGDETVTTSSDVMKRSEDEFTGMEQTTDLPRHERMMEEPSMMTGEQTTDLPRHERMMEEPSMMTGEQTTDLPRHERMMKEPSSFMETTEESHKHRGEMEDPSMMTDEKVTVSSETTSEDKETESHHDKRGLVMEDLTDKRTKESTMNEMRSEFTTMSTPLFTTISSAVAPELYTRHSSTISPIELSPQKYVGSLADGEEDLDKKDSRKDNRKHKTEEEKEHDKLVDSEERKDSKDKHSSDSNEDTKYAKAVLYDQDTLKTVPALPNNFAVLDESIHIVTDMTNTKSDKLESITEQTKLTQGKESS